MSSSFNHHCIDHPCDQDDPITAMNGFSTGRCKVRNTANPMYVPVYVPRACPDVRNYGPRRNELYCPSNPSLSTPLSSSEYLRRRIRNGNRPLGNSFLVQTSADTGKYRRVIWTSAGTSYLESTADGIDLKPYISQATVPPVTGTMAASLDAGMTTLSRMAIAARGSRSGHDIGGTRFDSLNTWRRMGRAIISNPGGYGAFNEACIACDLSGTSLSVIVGQTSCTCVDPKYKQSKGPFGLLWGQQSYGDCYASPAISVDGRLMYVGSTDYVYGIDTSTGNFIWYFENPFVTDGFFFSYITVGPDGTVYVGGSVSPYFFAVNGLTGALKWHYTTGNSNNYFAGKAAVMDSVVYVTSNGPNASLYAFSLSGALLNTYTNPDMDDNAVQSPCCSSSSSGSSRVYLAYNEHLVALDAELNVIWTAACGSMNTDFTVDWFSPRVDASGLIYVGSDDNSSTVYCFNASGVEQWTWTAPTPSFLLSPVFGSNGQVYVASNTLNMTTPATLANASSLVSLSSSGSVVWTYNFLGSDPDNAINWIFPCVADDKIYITNIVDSNLIILKDDGYNFRNYKEIIAGGGDSGQYGSACLSPPVVGSDGLVFWCNANQELPSIFGAGYPTVTTVFEEAVTAPVYIPHMRVVPHAAASAVAVGPIGQTAVGPIGPTAAATVGPIKLKHKLGPKA